ncbi:inner membrane protein YhjD [Tomitella gaofuii]|uniref:inner membrane protein YhjD n=1 Tax=Tomitella gaofuii TaxID=2760083 RepID=UPI0015FC8375|nr:inner membrane protein YhjD [Tomitella gaofuii]
MARSGTATGKTDEDKGPSFLDRRRAAWPWFDHVMRAAARYKDERGDHYAAAVTYFTVLALFPLLMVAFAVAGFVLAGNAELLDELRTQITDNVPGSMGGTINELVDTAINSRAAVGVLGILGALYTGLGWMAHLRAALTEQWEQTSPQPKFLAKKVHDLGALCGLGAAMVVSLGVTALGSGALGKKVLEWLHLDAMPGAGVLLTVVSVLAGVAASWALFTWVIARLPRERVALRSAAMGALLAAIAFEVFKRVAVVYLSNIVQGPAGATFGPIIGIMVFSYITARITLFATAFAATSEESLDLAPVPVPDPVIIRPRVDEREPGAGIAALAGVGVGAAAGWGIGRMARDRRR